LRRHWKVVPRPPAGLRARQRDPARRDRQCHAWGQARHASDRSASRSRKNRPTILT